MKKIYTYSILTLLFLYFIISPDLLSTEFQDTLDNNTLIKVEGEFKGSESVKNIDTIEEGKSSQLSDKKVEEKKNDNKAEIDKEEGAKEKSAVKKKSATSKKVAGKKNIAKEKKPVMKKRAATKKAAVKKKSTAPKKVAVKKKGTAKKKTPVMKKGVATRKSVAKKKDLTKEKTPAMKKDAAEEKKDLQKKKIAKKKEQTDEKLHKKENKGLSESKNIQEKPYINVINPGWQESEKYLINWYTTITKNDIEEWAKGKGFYLNEDKNPVVDNKAYFVSKFGSKVIVHGLKRGHFYRVWIDFVAFRNYNKNFFPSELKIFIGNNESDYALISTVKFEDIVKKDTWVFEIPYKQSIAGSCEIYFREYSSVKGLWGIWDIIISDEKELTKKIDSKDRDKVKLEIKDKIIE